MKNLMNTALLGTAQQPMPDFFTQAALLLARDTAARLPEKHSANWQNIAPAPHDDTPVLPENAAQILQIWLSAKQDYLIDFAYEKMAKHGFRLPEKLLPEVLAQKTLPNPAVLGEFGKWLCNQIPQNQTLENENTDDWTLLPHAQRLRYLADLRRTAPDEMREQLSQIWKTAPANQRVDYIELFLENVLPNDLAFLTAALKDRSANVKEIAQNALFRLPESEIAQQNIAWLKERLSFESNKWTRTEQPFTPEMKAAGIDELSPNKKQSDFEYQLGQIVERMSLAMWAVFLNCDENQAVKMIVNHQPMALSREKWLNKINDVDFTLALVDNAIASASGKVFANKKHIPQDVSDYFVNLPDEYREKILQKHGFDLSVQYVHFWRDREKHATPFGELYAEFVLFNIMKTTDYAYGYGLSSYADFARLAASLPSSDAIANKINHIREYIQQPNFPDWKREHYQQFCEYFVQKMAFEKNLFQAA